VGVLKKADAVKVPPLFQRSYGGGTTQGGLFPGGLSRSSALGHGPFQT